MTGSQDSSRGSLRDRDKSFHFSVLSSIADGVICADRDGIVIFINAAAQNLTGWEEREAIGAPLEDVFRPVYAKTRGIPEGLFHSVLEEGKTADLGEYNAILTKYGADKLISASISPIRAECGDIAGVVIIFRDVEEHKGLETALKESEEKFRSLFNHAVDSIFVHELTGNEDKPTRIIEVNDIACNKLGYTRDELLTMSTIDITPKENHAFISGRIKYLLENRHGIYENVHVTKAGERIPVEVSSHIYTLTGKKVILSIARDITERKRAEQEMERAMRANEAAYRAKSEFLANMSHEIRTPLNGVIGMLDLTLLSDVTPDQRENLLTAKSCADSLLKIINDILDFSKIEAGKMEIENIGFDVKSLIEKVVKVHYYHAQEKGCDLTYQLPARTPSYIMGDPGRLQQVLNNLVSNAVKFTDSGSVSLGVKVLEEKKKSVTLEFSIADTGIGIAKDEMDKLFKSFSQVDSSHTRKYSGTGLGLVISKQLIEMMGGKIEVQSEKGKGSIFRFSLNFGTAGEEFRKNGPKKDEQVYKTKSEALILLAEDDKVNQTVTGRMLKEMGYSMEIAENGKQAVDMLEARSYDLCLMDVQMPQMDGMQATMRIRERERVTGGHMPIIALTAHALLGDREKFISMGMDEYVAKPVQMAELYHVIENLLDRREKGAHGKIPAEPAPRNKAVSESGSLLKDYVEKVKPVMDEIYRDIQKLKFCKDIDDLFIWESTAHNIKNNALKISADKLKTMAFRIELAVRRNNLEEAMKLLVSLEELFSECDERSRNLQDGW